MTCSKCGAALRAGARFCNNCGARQAQSDDADAANAAPVATLEGARPTPGGQEAPTPESAADDDGALGAADNATRMKRPPRPPRGGGGAPPPLTPPPATGILAQADAQQAPATLPGFPAPDATLQAPRPARATMTPAPGQLATLGVRNGAPPAPPAPPTLPDATTLGVAAGSSPAAPATSDAWADEETAEYSAIVAAQGGQPDPTTSATPPTDSMPWPLPLQIIVAGRYRVEAVIASAGDGADAENTYRVSDLQGYEKCWSCGSEYGPNAAPERFCPECGADMLSREYRLTERRLVSGATADEADTQAEDAAAYAAQIDQLRGAANASNPANSTEARVFTLGARVYRVAPKVETPLAFPLGAHVIAAGASDVGLSRAGDANEDSFGIFALNLSHDSRTQPLALCIVADGLGGHANGQDASRLVTRAITEYVLAQVGLPFTAPRGSAPPPEVALGSVLQEAVQVANAALYEANQQAEADMGSTLVAALISGEMAYVVNVGDSRGYALSPAPGEPLRRLTTDHSLVEQLIISGLVKPEDRYTHPHRNQIFRSLGGDATVEVDLFTQRLLPGMRLLLCSDGLWEMTRDDELAQILRDNPNPRAACQALIVSANAHGGEDNITAVVVEVSA